MKQFKMKQKQKQKSAFLDMLLGTLGASLLGNMAAGKWINRAGDGKLELVMDLKDLQKTKNF